ncbi:hypothetical protein [Streptomyces sp. N35]|uniref:hypothetical protein n=1 Tax=Streptomyces sp. N35 TaxID=2795730 RepID=UPI0035ABD2BF
MHKNLPDPARQVIATFALAALTAGAWAGWLGWDQRRDVHPDGSTTGPYEAWQVIGLVLTLLAPLYWAATRRHPAVPVVGITAGLTVAAFYDWSDDASGLFMVGVTMVLAGSLAVTSALSAVLVSVRTPRGPGGPARRWGAGPPAGALPPLPERTGGRSPVPGSGLDSRTGKGPRAGRSGGTLAPAMAPHAP